MPNPLDPEHLMLVRRGLVARSWKMQDAKARFSALIQAAREHGPQDITSRGKVVAVVLSRGGFERLGGTHQIGRQPMTPTITAFEHPPDRGQGLARDTRVRWALEEVGQAYAVRLLSFAAMKAAAHRALHPFGQIPTYEEGDLVLFESGAIVLHIASSHAGLLPQEPNARARAISWVFAALNTVEPPILDLQNARILERDQSWSEARLPLVQERIRVRLSELSDRLGDAEWLDGAFSAGDLMVVSVLQRLKSSGMLDGFPRLSAYVARGEARPAYLRAFDAQWAVFAGRSGEA